MSTKKRSIPITHPMRKSECLGQMWMSRASCLAEEMHTVNPTTWKRTSGLHISSTTHAPHAVRIRNSPSISLSSRSTQGRGVRRDKGCLVRYLSWLRRVSCSGEKIGFARQFGMTLEESSNRWVRPRPLIYQMADAGWRVVYD